HVVPVVFSLIFLVGVVGNSLVIFIILRNKAMRTTPNIFIGSLALGDLLLLLVSVPFYGMIYTLSDWPHGEFLCRLNGFLVTLSLGVSIFTLTALKEWGAWFTCFRTSMRFVVYFVVPIVIIGVLYLLMARSLWTSGSFTQQSEAAARQTETRRKVAILVLSIVVLFVICWLPRHIYTLWFDCPSYGWYSMFWHVYKIVSFCLSFMNSCVNPLALYLLSDQFRRHSHQLIRC
ncbi:hypothetical protein CAPTEDRAFT_25111, partial [Capitella teleta]